MNVKLRLEGALCSGSVINYGLLSTFGRRKLEIWLLLFMLEIICRFAG